MGFLGRTMRTSLRLSLAVLALLLTTAFASCEEDDPKTSKEDSSSSEESKEDSSSEESKEDSSSEESKGTSSESSEEDSDESLKLGYMWGPRIAGRNWLYWQPNMVVDKKAAVEAKRQAVRDFVLAKKKAFASPWW